MQRRRLALMNAKICKILRRWANSYPLHKETDYVYDGEKMILQPRCVRALYKSAKKAHKLLEKQGVK
jgi:hypothetical protein